MPAGRKQRPRPSTRPLLSIVSLALTAVSALAGQPMLAQIDAGRVAGIAEEGIVSFKGIPYAAPPVGSLRWRPPQPVRPWEGVRRADRFGPSCMQAELTDVSEDCLSINVWRPAAPAEKLPVLVWIHGGGLVRGGASFYPAQRLAARGAVLVSFNYRLGRLGFFAHPALAAEAANEPWGNYGYLDQQAALRWVQRNIDAFGGDPDRVTIFGESAGGGSVLVHLASPLSRGLFRHAIAQSPAVPSGRSQITPIAELDAAEQVAAEYAGSLGIAGGDAAALAALRALPAATLTEGLSAQAVALSLIAERPVPGMAMAIRDGKVVVEPPEAAFDAGQQMSVPVIIGDNDRELPIGAAASKDELFARFGDAANAARAVYDPQGDRGLDELAQQAFADRGMLEPARHAADALARAGQPVWLYRFSYVSKAQRSSVKGAEHGFEIPYVFAAPEMITGDKITPADTAMADMVARRWIAFAATGDPNRDGAPDWPRHEPGIDRLGQFTNAGFTVAADPRKSELDLWQKVWQRQSEP